MVSGSGPAGAGLDGDRGRAAGRSTPNTQRRPAARDHSPTKRKGPHKPGTPNRARATRQPPTTAGPPSTADTGRRRRRRKGQASDTSTLPRPRTDAATTNARKQTRHDTPPNAQRATAGTHNNQQSPRPTALGLSLIHISEPTRPY